MNITIKTFLVSMTIILIAGCGEEYSDQKPDKVKKQFIKVRTQVVEPTEVNIKKRYYAKLQYGQRMTHVSETGGIVRQLHIEPGQVVKKGQLLVSFPPIDHDLHLGQMRLQYQEVADNFARQQTLFEKGAVSKVSLDQLRTQKEILKLNLALIEKTGKVSAPFSGVITDVFVAKGQEVLPGAAVFSLANKDSFEAAFFVPGEDLSALNIGDPVTLRHGGRQIEGEISQQAIQMTESRKGYKVLARFSDTGFLKLSGQTVELELVKATLKDVIMVPSQCITKIGTSQVVYIIDQKMALRKEVITGKRIGNLTQIKSGLALGDQLIIAGLKKLKPGIEVEVIGLN